MSDPPVALLYDIHGNLPVLEAVLHDAEAAGATNYLLGGDYAAFGSPTAGRPRGKGHIHFPASPNRQLPLPPMTPLGRGATLSA